MRQVKILILIDISNQIWDMSIAEDLSIREKLEKQRLSIFSASKFPVLNWVSDTNE